MDTELFELCKQVYEKTGWDSDEDLSHWQERIGGDGQTMLDVISDEPGVAPLYTSDYLLEKLPKSYKSSLFKLYRSQQNSWWAGYAPIFEQKADTALKALLKLTIALHEAGELHGTK